MAEHSLAQLTLVDIANIMAQARDNGTVSTKKTRRLHLRRRSLREIEQDGLTSKTTTTTVR